MAKELTTLSATGTAETKYDVVTYNVSISGQGKTGPEAKEAIRPVIDKLLAAIDGLKVTDGLQVDDKALRGGAILVDKLYKYIDDAQAFVGYTARYDLSVPSPSVDLASKVHDVLTSIDGIEAAAPQFSVKNPAALQKQALLDARTKLSEQLALYCEVLCVHSPEKYDIESFNVQSRSSQVGGTQMRMATAASASPESVRAPVEIKIGTATVSVTVNASIVYRGGALDRRVADALVSEPAPTHVEEGPHFCGTGVPQHRHGSSESPAVPGIDDHDVRDFERQGLVLDDRNSRDV